MVIIRNRLLGKASLNFGVIQNDPVYPRKVGVLKSIWCSFAAVIGGVEYSPCRISIGKLFDSKNAGPMRERQVDGSVTNVLESKFLFPIAFSV